MSEGFTPIPELAMRVDLAGIRMQLGILEVLVDRGIATAGDVERVLNHFEDSFAPYASDGVRQVEQLALLQAVLVEKLAPLFAALREKSGGSR
ncbi:hypothetical protein [Novosphingobium colocasiae]|uniref:hypothetical protein n=1 Tax=Novosphingobium colocasiae TaxID=1256513 RepID=UPI0035B219A5